MTSVPYQPMPKRSRALLLSVVTAVAAGVTTAVLDYATARWSAPEPTAATLTVPESPPSAGAVEPASGDVIEKRGRVLGIKWATKRKE